MAAKRRAMSKLGPADSEASFLRSYDVTAFERPSVAVDVALLAASEGHLHSVVVRREQHPHKGRFALPGGFVGMQEGLDAAAARVLQDKAGIGRVFLEQLYTFGAPGRDPRTRVISVAFYALVERALLDRVAGAACSRLEIPWEGETGGPVELVGNDGKALPLAFDHAEILGMAVKRVRGKLDYTPIGFQLLPDRFTLLQLQRVHETVLGRPLNKDSFRRRMLASGQLDATGESQTDVEHRPAELYRISKRSAV